MYTCDNSHNNKNVLSICHGNFFDIYVINQLHCQLQIQVLISIYMGVNFFLIYCVIDIFY